MKFLFTGETVTGDALLETAITGIIDDGEDSIIAGSKVITDQLLNLNQVIKEQFYL